MKRRIGTITITLLLDRDDFGYQAQEALRELIGRRALELISRGAEGAGGPIWDAENGHSVGQWLFTITKKAQQCPTS